MNEKAQHKSVMIALGVFALAVLIVGTIGYFTIGSEEEVIQGQIDVEEYRVSSKVPARILELRVKEGDYVHVGDTLAILDAPEVEAKAVQAESVESAATAISNMAKAGARKEQIQGAYEIWQQAKAGLEISKKSYERVQRLFDEGVLSEQKRDEAYANFKAFEAQEKAAKSQYDMAVNGARTEEKAAAAAQVNQAKGAVKEVSSYIRETVQIAQMEGEVAYRQRQSYNDHQSHRRRMGCLQYARGPAQGLKDRRQVQGFPTCIQPGDRTEGDLHKRPRQLRHMEGYEIQRTI